MPVTLEAGVDDSPTEFFVVVRVGTAGQPAFQLRKGEEGLSVFVPVAVDPPLTEEEILSAFRPGSVLLRRTSAQVAEHGLALVRTIGADYLPERLRTAHAEIRPGDGMDRAPFKSALRHLE
jgi:hypothetical protein